jgi:hypothetical protein
VVSRYLAAMTLRRDPYASGTLSTSGTEVKTPAEARSPDPVSYSIPNIDHRWGNGQAEILGIQLLDPQGNVCESIDHGKSLILRVSVRFNEAISQPILGFVMRNRLGEDIGGTNTSAEGVTLPPAPPSQIYTLDFHVQLPILQPGNYSFSVAVANGTHEDYVICDWVENAIALELNQRQLVYGYMKFDCRIELKNMSPVTTNLRDL